MIDQMYLMLYNLVFTALPPLVIGVYDKTIAEDLLFAKPYLYRYVSIDSNVSIAFDRRQLIQLFRFAESFGCRLSTAFILDQYAGLTLSEFGYVLCGGSRLLWI